MDRIKRLGLITILALSGISHSLANDGAFRATGNQLIPIFESNISAKKEILTLKKVKSMFMEVTVYYEFFNPGEEKTITVGFEAFSPMGDVDGTPKNGTHPYMRDFTVQHNGQILTYDIAYVTDSDYAANGILRSKPPNQVLDSIADQNYVDFFYVYYFMAKFKKGLNIVKHTYSFDLSNSVEESYFFNYVLTAANRWGNRQIDDFTLIVDMGEFESFNIGKDFFTGPSDWLINGIGKCSDLKKAEDGTGEGDALTFHIQKGNIIFQRKNFHPTGELYLFARLHPGLAISTYLPFSYYQVGNIPEPVNELEKRILRNLPFARRGYVFQSEEIRKLYEKMDWYIPNPNYVADVAFVTDEEKKWIEKWK